MYITTIVEDGIYKVIVYSSNGEVITNKVSLNNSLYRKIDDTYYLLLETNQPTTSIIGSLDKIDTTLYSTIVVDGVLFKTYLKTPVVENTSFKSYTIQYSIHTPLVEMSTPFLDRFNYFMPKWSTAYKNSISNYSKITYPLFANIEKSFTKTSSILKSSSEEKGTFKRYIREGRGISKVTTEDGIPLHYTYNIELSPYTRATIGQTKLAARDLISIDTKTSLPIFLKKKASRLYIKGSLGCKVILTGITEEGSLVEESFNFSSNIVKQSKYKYYKILSYSSTKNSLATNFIDTSKDFLCEHSLTTSSFIGMDKIQQYPEVSLENNYVKTTYYKDSSFPYLYTTYKIDSAVKSLYINDSQNILSVREDGVLCSSILKQNLEVDFKLLDNNNNNSIVYKTNHNLEDDTVLFTVDTKEIIKSLQVNFIIVKVQTSKGTFYLNGYSDEFSNEISNYAIDKLNNLEFNLSIEDSDFINVIVEANDQLFQASYIKNKVKLTPLLDNVNNLLVVNDKYYIEKDNNYLEIELYKDYYETDSKGTLVLYSDSTKIFTKSEKEIHV